MSRHHHTSKLIVAFVSINSFACATKGAINRDEDKRDLDVQMEPKSQKKTAPTITSSTNSRSVPKVPEDAVTNWRLFFKAPPNTREKSILEKRLTEWPEQGDASDFVAKGRTEVALGRLIAAETSFKKALRRDGENLPAILELSALYLRMQKTSEAFDFLAQAKEIISTSDHIEQSLRFKYRYTLALAYIARGDRDKGHKVLSDLIAIDKTFTPAYTSLAASYLAVGRESTAEFVVRRGLDRVQDNASLYNILGLILKKQRHFDEARSYFDKAIQSSPTFVPAIVNRAVMSTEGMEYGSAEEDLRQALALDPQNGEALVALGVVQKRMGNPSGAKLTFSKAIDTSPNNAFARFNLAVLLNDHFKQTSEALRLFQEVTQTPGANLEIKDSAARYVRQFESQTPQ